MVAESTAGVASGVGSSDIRGVGAGLAGLAFSSASGAAGLDSVCGADSDPAGSEVLPAFAFAELVSPVFTASEEGACSSNSAKTEPEDASEEDVSARIALPEAVKHTPGGIQRSAPSESASSSSSPESW